MWAAAKHGKVGIALAQKAGGEGIPNEGAAKVWRKVLGESEDILTATVLERLGYLPGTLGLELLVGEAVGADGKPMVALEPIAASVPWPRIRMKVSEKRLVEPDWIFETESQVVVVEAKWGAGNTPECAQIEGQLAAVREWSAGKKTIVQVALVHSGAVSWDGGPEGLVVTWAELLRRVMRKMKGPLEAGVRRVLEDVRAALDARNAVFVGMGNMKGLEVRAASRLLMEYFRGLSQVLAAIGETACALEVAGGKLAFCRWKSTVTAPVPGGDRSPAGRWGLDFLPLYDAGFRWTSGGNETPSGLGSMMLYVQHRCDTGFLPNALGGQPDLEDFASVDTAETVLRVEMVVKVGETDAERGGAPVEEWWRIHDMLPKEERAKAEDHTLCAAYSCEGWDVNMDDLATYEDLKLKVLDKIRSTASALSGKIAGGNR
jgi:hypothetical protein